MDAQDMVDIHGRRRKVILTDGGHKPVAVARRIQEFETKQHHLRPETMVNFVGASRHPRPQRCRLRSSGAVKLVVIARDGQI